MVCMCFVNTCTGCLDILAEDLNSGITVTTFRFGDNLVSNHQAPILLSHSKKVTMTGFPVMAYISDNDKTRGTRSGNTD